MRFWLFFFALTFTLATALTAEELGVIPPDVGPEEMDVEKIKQKYWARGRDEKLEVVQNRAFPRMKRFELGVAFSGIAADSLLITRTFSGSLGYHFSENFSLHAEYATASVGPSAALVDGRSLGATFNPSEIRSLAGAEARWSFLYGKLNALGSPVYLDGFIAGGLGVISTTTGNAGLLSAGVGQQLRPSPWLAINLSGKLYLYQSNFSAAAQLGLSVWFGPFF